MKVLTQEDFNKRCHKVFTLRQNSQFYSMYFDKDNCPRFIMDEYVRKFNKVMRFAFKPNMTERPQALAYLMGERSDFND